MDNTLVSIALCTYNGEKFLSQQLDSLINQSYKNIEILISDDCSSDGTITIINEYIRKDNRIRLIRNKENLGFNLNFENALVQCNGEIIAISDQDDIWSLDKIETVVNAFEEDVVLVHHSVKVFFDSNLPNLSITNEPIGFHGSNIDALFDGNSVQGCTIALRKNLLDVALPFNKEVYYDWWLATCAASIGKVKFLHKNLIYHRRHNESAHYSNEEKYRLSYQIKERCKYLTCVLERIPLVEVSKNRAEALLEKYTQILMKKNMISIWYLLASNGKIFFPKKSSKKFPIFSYMIHAYKKCKAF